MTREEAVYQINQLAELSTNKEIPKITEALEMAIEALQGDMYCPDCGVRLVPEDEYLEPTQTHGRLIDADALYEYITNKVGGVDCAVLLDNEIAPTVQADRPSKADKDGMDMEQAKEYCKARQHNEVCRYYPYDGCQFKDTDRPHGEWIFRTDIPIGGGRESAGYVCSNCRKDYFRVDGMSFCPNCGAYMRGGK